MINNKTVIDTFTFIKLKKRKRVIEKKLQYALQLGKKVKIYHKIALGQIETALFRIVKKLCRFKGSGRWSYFVNFTGIKHI